MDNSILNKAKYSENTDEWYTADKTVQEELSNYITQFHGKSVLCNCDDPESAFSKYFLKNFNVLKLKKLICTSKSAYVMEVSTTTEKTIKKLNGNGDFRSVECIEFLKKADIIVTNPPFSKFIDLFSLIMMHRKKFLLIGNQNAITYKEIFPYIKNGKAWIGYRFGDMSFKVPSDTMPRKTRFWIDKTGQKWRSLGNAMWLTNLDTKRKHEELKLTQYYTPIKYPKYDNFNAINIARVADIPKDYNGIMGVPLTYLKYHNEDQFEIVGEANHGSDNEYDLFKPVVDGKEIFKRILIKRK